MSRVLFVGVRNAGRSQIAEALFDQIAAAVTKGGPAGSKPGKQVHPQVVEAMGELGIDLSSRVFPKRTPLASSHRSHPSAIGTTYALFRTPKSVCLDKRL